MLDENILRTMNLRETFTGLEDENTYQVRAVEQLIAGDPGLFKSIIAYQGKYYEVHYLWNDYEQNYVRFYNGKNDGLPQKEVFPHTVTTIIYK